VESRDHEGRTILHVAAENDKSDVAKLALDLKVNLDAQDKQGQTVRRYTGRLVWKRGCRPWIDIWVCWFEVMIGLLPYAQALFRAVVAGKEQMAFFLLRSGANVEIPNAQGQTVWDKTDQYLSRSTTQRMRSIVPLFRLPCAADFGLHVIAEKAVVWMSMGRRGRVAEEQTTKGVLLPGAIRSDGKVGR